jgi:hypothetical protein
MMALERHQRQPVDTLRNEERTLSERQLAVIALMAG